MSDEESLTGPAVDEDEDVVMLKKREEQVEEDEEFEKEFSKMMSESVESRKFEKKSAMLDVPIPMHLRGGQGKKILIETNLYIRMHHLNILVWLRSTNVCGFQ
jgi:regulator of nonsense transcripts 2